MNHIQSWGSYSNAENDYVMRFSVKSSPLAIHCPYLLRRNPDPDRDPTSTPSTHHNEDLSVVVGAGIGGLQTALALAADGHTVTVLESVKEFLEVGAGIRVPPNSSRLSLSWGVDLNSVPKEISHGNRFVDWHGNHLLDCPFDDVREHYGAPYYYIHRADLIDALVSTARSNARSLFAWIRPSRKKRWTTIAFL